MSSFFSAAAAWGRIWSKSSVAWMAATASRAALRCASVMLVASCGQAGATARKTSADTAETVRRARLFKFMMRGTPCFSGTGQDFDAVRTGEDCGGRHAEEKAMLHYPRYCVERA